MMRSSVFSPFYITCSTTTNCVASVQSEAQNPGKKQQPRVLYALDVAKTQLFHFTAILITGMGFFTDAYDLFCVSLITDLLGRIYYQDNVLPQTVLAAVNGIALCGTVLGQLVFGCLGDKEGRRHAYGVTLKLMVVCFLASGLSFHRSPNSIIITLCFFRFWLGFGVGGDYPLSATIMAEFANKKCGTKTRGAFMAAVFAMQGLGNLAAGTVAILVSKAFKNLQGYETAPDWYADYVWRIILMVGAIPAALTYYWCMKLPETARYTALIDSNVKQAALDMKLVLNFNIEDEDDIYMPTSRNRKCGFGGVFSKDFINGHGIHLLSATVCWLVLDVSFYLLNLFMKDIFAADGIGSDTRMMSPLEQTYSIARQQALIGAISTLPGFFFAIVFMDRIGRIKMQLLGFAMMTVSMLSLDIAFDKLKYKPHLAFAAIYSSILFFANLGPNSTTFILPAEIFPARLRSTCHGIAGARGKVGAILGVLWFLYVKKTEKATFFMLAGCSIVGLVFTFLLPESKGRSLEDITE